MAATTPPRDPEVPARRPARVYSLDSPGHPHGPVRYRFALRTSAEWLAWLHQLAEHCRVDATTVVDQALARYADGVDFRVVPPPRTSVAVNRARRRPGADGPA